ncbi:Peroxisome biosynthesis protein pex1 [Ascochyta rabiei]|uniref:Peroxisomal ATPase PEX1 n=1 Tax=Didymella rabiei TaxID=5454 RepID=A0A163D8T2_DIDRA|nr:Peroxisome biosynthesis protein pex1 [Ascochyta rabiei]KZM22994.1 ATPase activity, coupled [Ascochyta rabiei]UPX17935.1 Peroxisome biosynthesis protein pex1 [Ascochyta rabiei]
MPPMPPKKPAGSVVQAEVALQQSLKNCLVNLPASLVAVLVNANAVAQNVVVELSYRQPPPPGASDARNASPPKSVFVGWTGMQSKRRLAAVVDRNGLRNSPAASQQDMAAVEVDATFARLIGLSEGQKVGIQLHLDPPQAHTINIEPLTPVDWEMIELHAQFLELNFLSQIRALPNPQAQTPHPLTLHLSPTTTANIVVTSVTPAPPAGSLFVKISPDAEVIVAPKTRQKPDRSSANRESRSVGAVSRKSGKSTASTVRRRSGRDEAASKGAVFLRGVDRSVAHESFDEEDDADADGLKIWVDKHVLLTKALRGATWVSVAIIKPAGLQEPVDMSKEQDQEKTAARIVARISAWEDAPDSRHVALSTDLCKVLGFEGFVGGLVRIEGAPNQTPKPSAIKPSTPASRDAKEAVVKSIKVIPFASAASLGNANLKFGGESKQEQENAIQRLKAIYGKKNGLLDGPVTDGMVLPPVIEPESTWQGGIVKFDPPQPSNGISWVLFPERKPAIELGTEIATPSSWAKSWQQGDPLPKNPPELVGINPLIDQLRSHLTHNSSVLLSGGLGAGKSECAQLLAHQLRTEYLFHTIYFPCRKLITDEIRVATIKETLNRLFATAAWSARSGGNAVVILDDLDKLCPVETELQVGNENGRSRHVSESIVSIVRQYCSIDSGVVLLATAQGKEALNNVIVGGHIVREMVSLKAPNKDGRRKVLEKLAFKDAKPQPPRPQTNGHAFPPSPSNSRPSTSHRSQSSIGGIQHDTSDDYGFVVDSTIDFLDLAGQTDGYMPGDLVLLTSRARNEALIRSVTDSSNTVTLTRDDYASATKGFTPASLRNVTLQSSTTKWDSIGGLTATRQILLETLQYPTTYAPIFAQCPLRLRSGLLLYGFPGCGKTLLASAVAGECGLNFISVKGPEILNKYIGASEKSVRDLFERAEAARPCVLFFDEFDSIAPKRGHDSTGVTDRVVNQLLTQMDGAEGLSGVYVLAATSRPDLIDPALLRPGRLDKSLLCDMPDVEERIDILKAVTRKLHLAPSVLSIDSAGENLREIAQRTEGYSGADLQAVVYNAQLEAIHDVLGDTDLSAPPQSKKNGSSTPTNAKDKGIPDFSYFRYGDTPSPSSTSPPSSLSASHQLTERAQIALKIQALQALRRKQKALQRPQSSGKDDNDDDDDDGAADDDAAERKEPQILWKHIDSSLSSGRSSISAQERLRLQRIYREFVEGREGNLPSGQGGSEIGGRTSLM